MKKKPLDDAWSNMQEKMKEEPESVKWHAFSQKMRLDHASRHTTPQTLKLPQEANPPTSPISSSDSQSSTHWTAGKRVIRYRRWIAGTAAALILSLLMFTSAGNHALAALLNQFRMEQLTAVQKQDVKHLFASAGLSESTINQFGEFTHTSDGELATMATIKELRNHVDRELTIPDMFRSAKQQQLEITVSPSRTMAMKLNAEKLNETMIKLGAEKLLPLSIDSKQITLTLGTRVSFGLYQPQTQSTLTLSQRPVPRVTVEEGAPMEEALEAILQFPFIPANLKQELLHSHTLDSGSAPLPVIVPDRYEQIRIASTPVLWSDQHADTGNYAAVWVKDGQILSLEGTFSDQAAFMAVLKEMIQP